MNALTIYAALFLAFGQSEAGERPVRSTSELEVTANQLGSSKYEIRQQATELLWSAGEAAIPALELATQSKNSEVRSRAAYVLENLRRGIAVDTPREILREVQRYRDGDAEDKRFALKNLEKALRPRIVLGLIQSERDLRLRDEWSQCLERSIQTALLSGSDREVELSLQDAATNDVWIRHWAAHLANRGRLEQELTRLGQTKSPANPAEHAQRLAYLWRAKGELTEARRLAEQAAQASIREAEKNLQLAMPSRVESAQSKLVEKQSALDLSWELTLEQRDWVTAAKQLKVRIDRDPQNAGKDPETLGFAAAYHRLAGDAAGRDRYLKMLRDVAEEAAKSLPDLDPRRLDVEKTLIEKQWHVGKALLLNGEYGEAIHVLRRNHASFAFELLAHQQRYREAFDVAGVPYPNGFDSAWFEKIAAETVSADDPARQRFGIAMHALRQLYFLGQRDQVQQWLVSMQRATANDAGTIRRRMICDTAVKLGMRELAIEIGAVVLEREGSPSLLSVLYPNRSNLATVWWELFRQQTGNESLVHSLTRIDRCLLFRGSRFNKSELERLTADAEKQLPQLVEAKRGEWWHGIAETCLLHGERTMALWFFEKAAAISAVDAVRLGDLHAGDQHWTDAAEWYRRASEFDKFKPLPLYLQGRALVNAGREEQGQRLATVALLLPLGNDETRRDLAAGLKERGYREESLRQFELLLRTAEPGEQNVIEAAKQIGNAVYLRDELRGAECWETMVLCCLRTKWGFVDANGYVQIPFLVHKTRAKGLLKSGRTEEAIREVWGGQAMSPMNLELPEELIPELKKANRHAEADELFQRSSSVIRRQCLDFPNCATLHNNLAWLFARNGRELDEAFEHVKQALALDPDNPAYIDTLGEVHFRHGSFSEAIVCAERCLKFDPRSKHYQEQLARFREASSFNRKP